MSLLFKETLILREEEREKSILEFLWGRNLINKKEYILGRLIKKAYNLQKGLSLGSKSYVGMRSNTYENNTDIKFMDIINGCKKWINITKIVKKEDKLKIIEDYIGKNIFTMEILQKYYPSDQEIKIELCKVILILRTLALN